MIYKVWLPNCLYIGVDCDTFWERLNPKRIEQLFEGYQKLKADEQDLEAQREASHLNNISWATGLYFGKALASCFSKSAKYPDSPQKLFDTDNQKKQNVPDDNFGDTSADVLSKQFEQFANEFNKKFKK